MRTTAAASNFVYVSAFPLYAWCFHYNADPDTGEKKPAGWTFLTDEGWRGMGGDEDEDEEDESEEESEFEAESEEDDDDDDDEDEDFDDLVDEDEEVCEPWVIATRVTLAESFSPQRVTISFALFTLLHAPTLQSDYEEGSGDDDDEGEDWDELEKEAEEDDRKRKRREQEEDERDARKHKSSSSKSKSSSSSKHAPPPSKKSRR